MVYKRNTKNKLVYPKFKGVEFYETDPSDKNKEIYIIDNNIGKYVFNSLEKREIYASDNGKHYYNKSNDTEIYTVDLKKEFETFININNQDLYCKTRSGFEYYPKNYRRKDKTAKINNDFYYAKQEYNIPQYPRNEYGDEFAVKNATTGTYVIIVSENGKPIAPRKRNGFVNYMTLNGTEIVYEYNYQKFLGTTLDGNEQYPCTSYGDEYYPDNIFAKDVNGNLKYALDKNKTIIYPKFQGNEIYIENDKGSYYILKMHKYSFKQYVKHDKKFFYPRVILKNNKSTEMIFEDLYAENDGKKYYPRDSNGHEYINSKGELLDTYPHTYDNSIIIPNYKNKPLVKSTDIHLEKEIKCLLYRPYFKSYDFLSNCASNKTLDFNIFTKFKTNFINTIIIICTVIFILIFLVIISIK